MGDRKGGAFLSFVDRDTHPTSTRCRGYVCASDMFCDYCAFESATQWERFVRRVLALHKTSSRPSGSVPSVPPTSPLAETSSGVSLPGTSFSSSSLPLGGQGKQEGSQGAPGVLSRGACLWAIVWGALPLLLLLRERARWGLPARCRLFFPHFRLRCLSPILTARSTT